MTKEEQVLRDLCLEIVCDRIGGERFNELLIQSGIYLDDQEWEQANRLLGHSEKFVNGIEESLSSC